MVVMKRSSGVLLPLSSLPSPYGIGTLGKEAYNFIDFLSSAGQKYWQLLPLGPTGYGDSPYSSFSSFAGNPYYIDLDLLVREGLLEQREIDACHWSVRQDAVDYGAIFYYRFPLLRKAFERGRKTLGSELEQFAKKSGRWLEEYALYMSVKNHFEMKSRFDWPDEGIRLHRPESVAKYREMLADEMEFWSFLQYLFFKQWDSLKAYAGEKGISFIGDVPIYVAADSADVWSEPEFFLLDEQNVPIDVAGVPPDAFTDEGQLWGNPLYRYDVMESDGFGWWIRRIEGTARLFDVIRIDHFRGFESYWAVPYGDKTAENGEWRKGPGVKLVNILSSWFNQLSFIAEDLGVITPDVRRMLDESGLPGMKVLEFAFDPSSESDYLPHNCVPNSVCYPGTHDNGTILGWINSSPEENIRLALEYTNSKSVKDLPESLLRSGMSCGSGLFVVQMQDLLGLDDSSRMNVPGTPQGNWCWRMLPGADNEDLAERLRHITALYGRLHSPTDEKMLPEEKECAS